MIKKITVHIDTTVDYYVVLEEGRDAPLFRTNKLDRFETFDQAYEIVRAALNQHPEKKFIILKAVAELDTDLKEKLIHLQKINPLINYYVDDLPYQGF